MSRSFIVTKLELFSRYIYFFFPYSLFSIFPNRIDSSNPLEIRSPIWDKVVRFVVERAGRIMELNEEANEQSSPSLFFLFFARRRCGTISRSGLVAAWKLIGGTGVTRLSRFWRFMVARVKNIGVRNDRAARVPWKINTTRRPQYLVI